jgi:acyl-CoA thioesterase I
MKKIFLVLFIVLFSSLAFSQADTTNADYQKIQKLLQSKEPIIWLFTGNSITHALTHTNGFRGYQELFSELIRGEKGRMRDFVINTGISGSWIPEIVDDFDWRVMQFHPKVVFIMIGTNDAAKGEKGRENFKKYLLAFIDSVRNIGAIPVVQTMNTIYPFHKSSEARKDLPAYADIIRQVSKEKNTILVDHYKHWTEVKKTNDELLLWINDRSIHPNEFGHREFAKELFKTLGLFNEKSPTCKLWVP